MIFDDPESTSRVAYVTTGRAVRPMPIRQIRVQLRVVTPLFMGGADPQSSEWRVPTIKGLLRWWYRASHPPQPGETFERLRQREARIFGGVGGVGSQQGRGQGRGRRPAQGEEQEEGQGLFLLRSSDTLSPLPAESLRKMFGEPGSPLGYLGYGLAGAGGARGGGGTGRGNGQQGGARSALQGDADLTFVFRPACEDEDIEAVLGSLWLLCHLGGMGSRSRRGLGSVNWVNAEPLLSNGSLPPKDGDAPLPPGAGIGSWTPADGAVSSTGWPIPPFPPQADSVDTLISDIRSVIARLIQQLPPAGTDYTAFCHGAAIIVGAPHKSWEEALEAVGGCLQQHRTFRRQHPNYPDDHDLVHEFSHIGVIDHAPRRTVFGLPHNYFFTHDKAKVFVDASEPWPNSKINRRASPLLIHIEQLAGAPPQFVPVVSFFPARFLPAGACIHIHGGNAGHASHKQVAALVGVAGEHPYDPHDEHTDYAPIEHFLADFQRAEGAQEVRL